jgi:hypothetical protein
MENVSIRKATNTDVEELLKLRTLLQQHSEESNPSVWHITEEGKAQLRQKVEDAVTDSQSYVLIAESEEQTVDTSTAKSNKEPTTCQKPWAPYQPYT